MRTTARSTRIRATPSLRGALSTSRSQPRRCRRRTATRAATRRRGSPGDPEASWLLLVGASAINDWNDAFGGNEQGITAELTADGMINLVSAGLQIAGAVLMAGRNVSGRVLFSVGAAVCIGAGCYWLLRVGGAQAIIWTGVFVALPIIGLVLCWTAQSTAWLRGESPRPGPPRAFGT